MPKGRLPVLQAALQAVPESKRDSWKIHRVERGDTLASVAKRYAVTPASLANANTGEFPQEGEFLAIPASYPGDKPPAKKTAAATKKPAVTSFKKAPAKRS